MPVEGQAPQQVRYQPGSQSWRPTHWPVNYLMNICWYASLPIQGVILCRLVRWRAPLWWFAWMLIYEVVRSFGLILVRSHGMEAYRLAWALTEYVGAVLVLAATVEAMTRHRRPAIAIVTLIYAVVAGLVQGDTQDGLTALCNGLLLLRSRVLLAAAAALLVLLLFRMKRHTALLMAYCAIDAIHCSGILAGARGESRPAQFLIFGQTACLILWALFVPEIRKEME